MPKGTRIDCLAHFDNSAEQPGQPRPDADGVVGRQTCEEMMIGYIDYVEDLPAAGSVRPVSATQTPPCAARGRSIRIGINLLTHLHPSVNRPSTGWLHRFIQRVLVGSP